MPVTPSPERTRYRPGSPVLDTGPWGLDTLSTPGLWTTGLCCWDRVVNLVICCGVAAQSLGVVIRFSWGTLRTQARCPQGHCAHPITAAWPGALCPGRTPSRAPSRETGVPGHHAVPTATATDQGGPATPHSRLHPPPSPQLPAQWQPQGPCAHPCPGLTGTRLPPTLHCLPWIRRPIPCSPVPRAQGLWQVQQE